MQTTQTLSTRALAPVLLAVVFGATTLTAQATEAAKSGMEASATKQEQIIDRETLTRFKGWEDPDMARVAVHGGRALLRNVEAAHTALEEGKLGEARSDLRSADEFAQGLTLVIPFTVVVDNIRDAKHKLLASSQDVVVDDLLPIYANLNEMADYAPKLAAKAKTKLDEAVNQAKAGKKTEAAQKLDEVAADISGTTVYLPVRYVGNQVALAQTALNKEPADTKAAKTAIDNAMGSLVDASFNLVLRPEQHAKAKPSIEHAKTEGSS